MVRIFDLFSDFMKSEENKISVDIRELRFTLQFNAKNDSHLHVAKILKEKGRKKASYIADAILFYEKAIANGTENIVNIDNQDTSEENVSILGCGSIVSVENPVTDLSDSNNFDIPMPVEEPIDDIVVMESTDEHSAVDLSSSIDVAVSQDADVSIQTNEDVLIPTLLEEDDENVVSFDEDEMEDGVSLDLVLANLKSLGC